MADYPISNVARRIVYTGSAGVGPYAFNFEVLTNTDIKVYKNDLLLTLTTDYTVSISSTLGTGSVTLVTAATGSDRITIVGARAIQRTTDFTTGGDFFANTLNDEMDSQTILVQQVAETAERGIKAPVTDPTNINMTLPVNTARAGKTLAFDSSGNPIAGDAIGNWRGNWASGVSYQNRDLVKDTTNSNVYIVLTAHTSSGSLPITTNADSAKWGLVVDAAAAGDSATAAAASASAASTSASAASTSASNASTSASNASTSASTASTQASNASTSASTASTAATNAGNSATAAATSASNASTSASGASTSATNASNSASSASSSASTATTQASNASTSASAASTSASNASSSASAASTSATNASNSATSAASAQTAAEAARDQTLTAFDNFDDRYLGSKSSAPTVDNDGNALLAGALYFNSSTAVMNVYTGSVWVAAYVSGTGFLASASNLSDLGNVVTARDNLGVEIGVDVQAYDADIPTVSASQAEMEAGTETALRSMSPLRIKQAISALSIAKDSSTGAANLPAGTTAQRPATPVTGMTRYNSTLGVMEYYNGTAWYSVSYQVTPNVDFLVVAGGGGGGSSRGGVGGAGGLRSTVTATGGGGSLESKLSVTAGSALTVTVGAGGSGGAAGGNSVFSSITSLGGGRGGNYNETGAQPTGGSGGGGGGGNYGRGLGGAGTAGQGYAGGAGLQDGTGGAGGGGGGAGSAGTAATVSGVPGASGNGVAVAISGSSVTYAGVGGTIGLGGPANNAGNAGTVVIRYSESYAPAASTTGSPTITVTGGYRIYTWTGSGSITF
jgi:hypothetical protein